MVPTLLRSTAQGLTITIQRVVAGLAAFVTPALVVHSPRLLFFNPAGLGRGSPAHRRLLDLAAAEAGELEVPLLRVTEDGQPVEIASTPDPEWESGAHGRRPDSCFERPAHRPIRNEMASVSDRSVSTGS